MRRGLLHPLTRLLAFLSAALALHAEPFSVVVYNVENLFDADGEAIYDDYKPDNYRREHLVTKLSNTAEILAKFNRGRGPDIVLLQEIEGDRTPERWDGDLVGFLTRHTGTPVEELLGERFTSELAGIPAHVWLYKKLADQGLPEYFVAAGEPASDEIAHVNVTFSRFPITESRTHASPMARGTLETVIDVNGHPVHVFNCHWKSGASNAELEPVRVENARVVRERIDEILKQDPHADILIGGDLNSHYNHGSRHPEMELTGINTILRSQGDERALQRAAGPDLYNLWFELPPEERGSDVYRDYWGTLMHLIISRGLYDHRGIQYVDNSFRRAVMPGINADPITGAPLRWTFAGDGGGYSDHFPLIAWFRTVPNDDAGTFVRLENPSRERDPPSEAIPVEYAAVTVNEAPDAAEIAQSGQLKGPRWFGRVLRVSGEVSGEHPFRVTVGGEEFQIWSFDADLRTRIYQSHTIGDRIDFYGELGRHRGNWQFVIRDESWVSTALPAAGRNR